jgi:cellulose synthase/poly-beta-1,6-N-acetylglucosamine synthase-like glycosyltransferase
VPDRLLEKLIGIGESEDAVMVCGMVILKGEKEKPSWWSKFQTMEFAVLQLCGMAAISQHKMLVNSGANLAFRKDAWVLLGGYESHVFIPSGDDTFLMMEMEKHYPGRVVAAPDAVVTTDTMPTFDLLVDQRSRWASKTRYYKSTYVNFIGVTVVLSAFAFVCNLILFIACTGGGASVSYPILIAMLLFITSELILLKSWSDKYRQPFAFWDGFRMSLLHPFFICFLLLVAPFNKSEWKGRKL